MSDSNRESTNLPKDPDNTPFLVPDPDNTPSLIKKGIGFLKWATAYGYTEAVIAIIEQNNLDINETDKGFGYTYLHIAAINGYEDTVKALIEKGAKVDKSDNDGMTPLHHAAQGGYTNVVKVLIEKEAKVDKPDNNGATPLHLTAKFDYKNTVNALIKANANVNAQNKDGNTPLHFAATNGHTDIVVALIKAGAYINAVDKDEKTPLDFTTNEEIKTLLQNAEKTDPVDESSTDSKGDQEEDAGAQTEEQPSSFFGSLFRLLMKPFSLIASFFGGFLLFGSDEPIQSSSESDQPIVLESPSSSEGNDII